MLPCGMAGTLIGAGGASASRFNCASFSCHLLKSRAWATGGYEGLPVCGRAAAAEVFDANQLVEFLVEHDLDHLGESAFGRGRAGDLAGEVAVKGKQEVLVGNRACPGACRDRFSPHR